MRAGDGGRWEQRRREVGKHTDELYTTGEDGSRMLHEQGKAWLAGTSVDSSLESP